MSTLEGAPCIVCNAGVLTAKVGDARGSFSGQTYYVCSNWQFHNQHKEKGDPLKSPWILDTDTEKVQAYLDRAAGKPPAKKAKPAAPTVTTPVRAPASAAINQDHVIVTISAKVAHIQSRLDHLISLWEAKFSTDQPEAEDAEQ